MKLLTHNKARFQEDTYQNHVSFFTAILYLIFLFLLLTGSNLRLGGVMLRYVFALILIVNAVMIRLRIYIDKTIALFLFFIIVFGTSCLVTGYERAFFTRLYYSYFMSLFGCVLVIALIKRDASFIKYITYLLLVIGAFDVIVTYSQFIFKDDWYRPIEKLLKLPIWSDMEEAQDYKSVKLEAMDMTLPGIFGNGVYNGYFLSVCTVLSMVFVIRKKNALFYIFPLYYLLGSFFCQQRGPLFISVFVVLLISIRLFKDFNNVSRFFLFVFLSVSTAMVISFLFNLSELFGLRYSASGLDSTGRDSITSQTFDYIMSHPIIPNAYELLDQKGHMPHNLFLNAYVYGGIVSFLLILYILFIQTKTFFKIVRSSIDGLNAYYYVFAWAWFAFTMNSMVHNRSIITGDYLIWLIWGIMIAYPPIYSRSLIKIKA